MKEKIAFWVSQRHNIPYKFRKSFVKYAYPKILSDYSFEINFYGLKYSGNTKDSTDRFFFMFGGYEKYMLRFMQGYCSAAKSGEFVFLDVGAHVGNHSLFMSQYATHIHAFEPNPLARESLNSKIYNNDIKNITVHPIGLSNENNKLPFYISQNDNIAEASFRQDHDKNNQYYNDLEVKIGDEIIFQRQIEKVDLIKIDVEGYERQVIEGLNKTIEKDRPTIILELSVTTRKSFTSRNDFESIFPKDYIFYKFSGVTIEKSRYKLTGFEYDKNIDDIEIVAVPVEKRIFLKNKVKKT